MEFLKFEPLLKQTIWGGDKIIPFKHLEKSLDQVGESWEVSGVKDNETVVANGEYKGWKLNDVLAEQKELLVGKENYARYGNLFPLLIKFIDARQQLSIQVHPNDEQAQQKGLPRGKTEMWYVMKSDPTASLRSGLKQQITPEEYKQMVEDDTITDALAEYPVKDGDVFFLPAAASTASARAASWPRSRRPATSLTASTTSSARTRTATIASSTPPRLPNVSTTTCCPTTAPTTSRPRTRAWNWSAASISPPRSMTSTSPCSSTIPSSTVS